MAVTITSKSMKLLDKLDIDATLIENLKAQGVKLTLGAVDFSFVAADGTKLALGTLPVSSNVLLSGQVFAHTKKAASQIVTEAGLIALSKTPSGVSSPVAAAALLLDPPVTYAEIVAQAAQAPVTSVMPEAVKVNPESVLPVPVVTPPANAIGPLNEAATMYQRVRGTSQGSVYVVVAFTDQIKVAARIHSGHHLAVRAEPADGIAFSAEEIHKLKSQQILVKGTYASGHFECDKVPVARTLGAVLVGLGIPFTTPFPDASIVLAKSV